MYARAPDQFEIVGVVSNERVRGLEQPAPPAYYLSTRQFPQTSLTILARTAGDPLAAAPDVRAAIRSADSATTVERPTSLAQILADQLVAQARDDGPDWRLRDGRRCAGGAGHVRFARGARQQPAA